MREPIRSEDCSILAKPVPVSCDHNFCNVHPFGSLYSCVQHSNKSLMTTSDSFIKLNQFEINIFFINNLVCNI